MLLVGLYLAVGALLCALDELLTPLAAFAYGLSDHLREAQRFKADWSAKAILNRLFLMVTWPMSMLLGLMCLLLLGMRALFGYLRRS